MKSILSLAVLLVLAITLVFAAEDNVVVIDGKNWDEKIKQKEYTLVEFYAPWCGHCKQLAPEYAKLADQFLTNEKIAIAKVNGDEASELMQKFEIQGFPTLKLFKNGELFRDYDGERSAEAIASWLVKKTGPIAVPIENEAALDKLRSEVKTIIVGVVSSKDSENYKNFIKAAEAKELEDFTFAEVVGTGLNSKLGVSGESVVVIRDFSADNAVSTDFDNIVSFVQANGYPLVDEVSGQTFQRFVDKGLPVAVLFYSYTNDAAKKAEHNDLLNQVATELQGKVSVGYSDADVYGEQLTIMGGDKTKLPGFAVMDIEKRQNYPYNGNLVKDEIVAFLNDVLSGKVEPYMRSQEPPATNDEAVKVVVGKTFKELVVDSEDDVLLEFYAPWCGHCKQLEPKYKQLAEELKDVKGLVIAKIDASENDTPVPIEGFPTIYFFPRGKKEQPIPYEGSRSVDDLKSFISKNAVASKDNLTSVKKDEL
ncbi:hypothetical protein ABK040_007642 [Willaertia magna]